MQRHEPLRRPSRLVGARAQVTSTRAAARSTSRDGASSPPPQPFQVLLVGPLQRNVRADEPDATVADDGTGRASRRKVLGELQRRRALAGQAVEIADVPRKLQQLRHAVAQHLALAAGLCQHVEVVAPRLAVPEKRDPAHQDTPEADRLDEEGHQPDQAPAFADADARQLPPAPKWFHQGKSHSGPRNMVPARAR